MNLLKGCLLTGRRSYWIKAHIHNFSRSLFVLQKVHGNSKYLPNPDTGYGRALAH